MRVASKSLPSSPGHPFYERLNQVLEEAGFDRLLEERCAALYSLGQGGPSIPLGMYFRMLLVGYFEGIDSQRGIAWRCGDSLALRDFLGLGLNGRVPGHSSLAVIRQHLPLELHEEVFKFVLKLIADNGLLRGESAATTFEANAAMKSIVRRDCGESWRQFLRRIAENEGAEFSDDEGARRIDRREKRVSAEHWESKNEAIAAKGRDVGAVVAFVLWSAALALAYAGQVALTTLGKVATGWWLLGGGAVSATAAALCLDRGVRRDWTEEPPPRRVGRQPELAAGLAAAAIALDVGSVFLITAGHRYRLALGLWLAALGIAAAAAVAWDGRRTEPDRLRVRPSEILTAFALVALAVVLRLPDLTTIPPEVHGDEAACGIAARLLLHGDVQNVFDLGWSFLSNVGFAISAMSMAVFGDDLFGLRMSSVLLGVATVLLTYGLARRLFSARLAALAAFLLAVGQWPIHFSRSGIDYMQATFATVLLFFLFHRGLDRQRLLDHVLAGFAAGLCFSVYYGARIAPVLVALFSLHRLVLERGFLRRHAAGLAALALSAALFMAPQAPAYGRDPTAFVQRASSVWIFAPDNVHHELESYAVPNMRQVMIRQTQRTLEAFNRVGETSLQYGRMRPLLDFWTGPLFVLGIAAATVRLLRPSDFVLASWFWSTLLTGSILTVDALFSPRVVALIPTLFLAAALTLEIGWRATERALGRVGGQIFQVLASLVLALALAANVQEYFVVHVRDVPAGFHTVLSAHVRALNDRYRAYFISRPDDSIRYDTEAFLIPNVDAEDVRDHPLELPLQSPPAEKGALFLIEAEVPDLNARLAAIQRAYPEARPRLLKADNGVPLFYSILVSHEALVAARGRSGKGTR